MQIDLADAAANLPVLLARVQAGEDIQIARDGVAVARLVSIEPIVGAGARFLAARGSLRDEIWIGPDFEFTEAELDEFLNGPV
jgi:antitoxin (DNA-binding transcriptional repressor) of toxin-antitoxin stability system